MVRWASATVTPSPAGWAHQPLERSTYDGRCSCSTSPSSSRGRAVSLATGPGGNGLRRFAADPAERLVAAEDMAGSAETQLLADQANVLRWIVELLSKRFDDHAVDRGDQVRPTPLLEEAGHDDDLGEHPRLV